MTKHNCTQYIFSGTSFASASTMLTASVVPATVKLISLSSSEGVGLIINLPSILPTTTPATGPLNGISEIESAKEDAKGQSVPVIYLGQQIVLYLLLVLHYENLLEIMDGADGQLSVLLKLHAHLDVLPF